LPGGNVAEIKGRIVRILSDTEVVINKGLTDGVKYSMEFVIYEEADPVVDPLTREVLARIELVKDRVYVMHIQDRICIAETAPWGLDVKGVISQVGRKGGSILNHDRGKAFKPKLDVDPADVVPPLDVSRQVKVGDKVRSIER
jgi:hypothetical protein